MIDWSSCPAVERDPEASAEHGCSAEPAYLWRHCLRIWETALLPQSSSSGSLASRSSKFALF